MFVYFHKPATYSLFLLELQELDFTYVVVSAKRQ